MDCEHGLVVSFDSLFKVLAIGGKETGGATASIGFAWKRMSMPKFIERDYDSREYTVDLGVAATILEALDRLAA